MDYGDKLPPSPQYIFTPPRRYIFTPPLTANTENVRNAARDKGKSALQDWLGGPHRQTVVEEVFGLGSYGKTLTVLTGMEPPDEVEDEDDDDDDELEKAWTPRFRR